MVIHSRETPSERYDRLIGLYSEMHEEGHFEGGSLREHLPTIRSLVRATGSRTLTDYGSGKGRLYQLRQSHIDGIGHVPSVQEYLGLEKVICYDPAVPEFSKLPAERSDGVVSTDVLEHIPQEDIAWVLDEMFGLAKNFVFAVVASFPAKKSLPNGENAHATQQPPDWWRERLAEVTKRHPVRQYRFEIEEDRSYLAGKLLGKRKRTILTSGAA